MHAIKNAWPAYLLGASLLACSSGATPGSFGTTTQENPSSDDSTGNSEGDSGNDRSVNEGTAHDAGRTATSGDAGTHASDAASTADAATKDWGDTETITLKMDDFVIPAGAEIYKCQQVGNPFGKDVDIVSMDGTMATGSHHFFMFDMDATTPGRATAAPLVDCPGAGLEFHPFPYLSQQPHFVQNMPEGFGYPLNTDHGLMFNVHYLNASSKDVTSHVSITIKVQRRGIVKTHVGTIFMNNTFFSVPPTPKATPTRVTASSTPLFTDYSLMTSWSHMHQWGLDFTASMGGKQFYEEKSWEEPPLFQHSPYIKVPGGTPISWSCSYYNDTGHTLLFGDSARDAVMCIYFGWYFPANPASPGIVTVLN